MTTLSKPLKKAQWYEFIKATNGGRCEPHMPPKGIRINSDIPNIFLLEKKMLKETSMRWWDFSSRKQSFED